MHFKINPIKLAASVLHGVGSGAELFIVEGDSAASTVSGIRNTQFQAVLPMQGKPLNALRANRSKVAGYELFVVLARTLSVELADARGDSQALALGELDKLNYDRLLLLFDPDADGIHCGALMLMFFYRWMRPLLESGRIEMVRAPMFELRFTQDHESTNSNAPNSNAAMQAYSEMEQKALFRELAAKNVRDLKVYRYRGLGNIDPALLAATCVDPASRKTTVVGVDDARMAIEAFGSPMFCAKRSVR